MDDASNDIKRNELLRLSGAGALAAVAALLANSGVAEAKETPCPRPKRKRKTLVTNPIGLDLLFTARPGILVAPHANEKKASKVLITGDLDDVKAANIVYTLKNPNMKGYLPSDPDHDEDLKDPVYVAIWY